MKLYRLPEDIVTDKDPTFTSKFQGELFKVQRVKLHLSSIYHSQTDGQTETTNKNLEGYLRCYARDNLKDWSNWLTMAEQHYNSSFHTLIKSTPYEATYDYPSPYIINYISDTTYNQVVDSQFQLKQEIIKTVQ